MYNFVIDYIKTAPFKVNF